MEKCSKSSKPPTSSAMRIGPEPQVPLQPSSTQMLTSGFTNSASWYVEHLENYKKN